MLQQIFLPLLAIATLSMVAVQAETAEAPRTSFAQGQMWSIKSVPTTTARVIIGRIEPWRDKVAVHVSLIDVPIPPSAPGAGGTTIINHMPFDATVLAASVDQLLATGVSPAPSFESGYKQWQSAKGGIFTVSVSKAIDLTFEAIDRVSLPKTHPGEAHS